MSAGHSVRTALSSGYVSCNEDPNGHATEGEERGREGGREGGGEGGREGGREGGGEGVEGGRERVVLIRGNKGP